MRSRTITINGTGVAESAVTIYDNDIPAAEATVKRGGSWTAELTLSGSDELYAEHRIHAVLVSEKYGYQVTSAVKKVAYDPNYLALSKITMINTAHTDETVEFVSVFDFLNPSSEKIVYNYWPAYPTFTFKVEFTRNDPSRITNVYVLTSAGDGTITAVPCSYDARLGLWVGTHDYTDSKDKPAAVTAFYIFEEYGNSLPTSSLYQTEDIGGLLERSYDSDRDGFLRSGLFGLGWSSPFDVRAYQQTTEYGSFIFLDTPRGIEFYEQGVDDVYRETTHGSSTAAYQDGRVSVTYANQSVLTFDEDGRPVSICNAGGEALTLNYENDLLVSVSNGGEQALRFSYEDGKVVRAEFDGQTAVYSYHGDYLISTQTSSGSENYSYYTEREDLALGALASVSMENGGVLTFDYDAYGRVTAIGDQRIRCTGEDTVTMADAMGNSVTYAYEDGLLKSVSDLAGGVVSFDYDELKVSSAAFADGATYSYSYDGAGNVSAVQAPDGGTVSCAYEDGLPGAVTDQLGNRTTFRYDDAGRLLNTGWADGTSASYAYGASGELVSLTRHDGSEVRTEYNEQGLLSRMTYPDGSVTAYSYDDSGNITAITEDDETTLISCDAAGNVTMIVYPDGKTITYSYDSLNRCSAVTDSAGFTTKYVYPPGCPKAGKSDP